MLRVVCTSWGEPCNWSSEMPRSCEIQGVLMTTSTNSCRVTRESLSRSRAEKSSRAQRRSTPRASMSTASTFFWLMCSTLSTSSEDSVLEAEKMQVLGRRASRPSAGFSMPRWSTNSRKRPMTSFLCPSSKFARGWWITSTSGFITSARAMWMRHLSVWDRTVDQWACRSAWRRLATERGVPRCFLPSGHLLPIGLTGWAQDVSECRLVSSSMGTASMRKAFSSTSGRLTFSWIICKTSWLIPRRLQMVSTRSGASSAPSEGPKQMFSKTSRSFRNCTCWLTCNTLRCGGTKSDGPPRLLSPEGKSTPPRSFSNEALPLARQPVTATRLPCGISKQTLSKICRPPLAVKTG
mmetsp:Transcript_17102/g.47071  ORF Transcript_17102/g.47071 Transcript_17102/m.47071 type:complete len:351 (+) Transcript_17102:546-1598(+)